MQQNSAQIVNAYRDIYEQYTDEAAFLWLMRSIAVDQPHYNVNDVVQVERRLQAQLDGLQTAPDLAWDTCQQALELEQPGETFTAAIIALKGGQQERIQQVVETGLASEVAFPGLVSAFGWLPAEIAHPWIERFLNSKELDHKYLALAICSIRRENPGAYLTKYLQRDDCIQHKKLYTRALRLIGELKRADLANALIAAVDADDEDIAFWANWSSVLLGNHAAISKLQPYIFAEGAYQSKAIDMIFRVMPVEPARSLIARLAENPEQQRAVVKAVGVLGDPHAVDWLITKTRETALSRLAGEAFTLITGIDLDRDTLSQDAPDDYQPGPNDDTDDDDVAMDEDENLPWPNTRAMGLAWNECRANFVNGQRYLLGYSVNPGLPDINATHIHQRQRHALALELALRNADCMLLNTRGGFMELT